MFPVDGRLALAAASYLSGGIPTGYLVAKRIKGIDIREHGSGNPGAANVYRVVGREAGLATLLVDALKGFVPVLIAKRLFPGDFPAITLCGALAILGHVWTIFLGFRGGKGVATSAGVFCALLPMEALPAFLAFALSFKLSGHISVGSLVAAMVLPLSAFLLREPAIFTGLACAAGVLIVIRHIPNLKRLIEGREPLFGGGPRLEKFEEIQ